MGRGVKGVIHFYQMSTLFYTYTIAYEFLTFFFNMGRGVKGVIYFYEMSTLFYTYTSAYEFLTFFSKWG